MQAWPSSLRPASWTDGFRASTTSGACGPKEDSRSIYWFICSDSAQHIVFTVIEGRVVTGFRYCLKFVANTVPNHRRTGRPRTSRVELLRRRKDGWHLSGHSPGRVTAPIAFTVCARQWQLSGNLTPSSMITAPEPHAFEPSLCISGSSLFI